MSNTGNNSGSGSISIGTGSGTSSNGNTWVIPSNTWVTGTITGGWITIIPEQCVPPEEKKKDNRDGCDCKKCKEFYPYAEPNQEDGTLICYACRHGY